VNTQLTKTSWTIPQIQRASGQKGGNPPGGARRRLADACNIEALESRVLMSVVAPAVVQKPTPPKPAPKPVHAPAKPAPKPVKAGTVVAPTSLTAASATPTSVQLSWALGDAKPTGFIILRATDGTHFTTLAKTTSATVTTYNDASALSFHTYQYEVEEYSGTVTSAASAAASITTGLAAPTTLTASVTTAGLVQLTWAINEPSASGYDVLRSTGGGFSQIAQLASLKTGTYLDTSVTSATAYAYEVQAYNGSNTSAVSKTATVTTPLKAPSALTASFSNGGVNLAWTDNDVAATSYLVQRSSDNKTFTTLATLSSGGASATDTSVLSGHVYYYKVQAVDGALTATTAAATVSTPLTKPSGLAATAQSATSVQLAWTDNDVNAASYLVLRSTDGVHYSQIAAVATSTASSYLDKTAVSGTTYDYEVRAVAGTIQSDASVMASVTTPLAAPATIAAAALSPTAVKLTWSMTDPLATGYNILQSTDGVNFSQISTVTGKSVLTYTDTSPASATTYYYQVQAYNATNQSAVSKSAKVTTPLLAPTALAATLSSGAMTISWTDNDTAAAGYYVLRSVDSKTPTTVATLSDGTATSYTDSAIATGHTYIYEVEAFEGANTSVITTQPAMAIDPLAAPGGLAATATSSTSVSLAWTDNDTDAAGYVVLRSTDGKTFTTLTKLTSATAATYVDNSGLASHTYTYEVQAINGTVTSPASTSAAATTLLATPSALSATATAATAVKLAWSDSDPQAAGFNILRSSGGGAFSQVAQLPSNKTTTYVDTSASSATAYSYQVQAYNTNNTSAATKAVVATTPLIAPSAAAATLSSGTVQLTWTDNDTNAAGYYVLRSLNNGTYAKVGTLSSATAASYSDSTILTGHSYGYEVEAFAGTITSPASTPATLAIPLNAPTALAATSTVATSVTLTWTDNDTNAAGYNILRSTDGTNYGLVVKLTGPSLATYTDTKASSGTSYTYEVQAYQGTVTSPMSSTAAVTTGLLSPTALTATPTGVYANLAWTDKDTTATGYTLLKSTDNVNFTTLATLTGATANSYIDSAVTAGTTYYYQVQATNGSASSAVSNTATVTMPAGNVTSGVSITTRYTDELVITAAGTSDSVSITESGSTLTIIGDGQSFTETAPAAGVFVYTRGGNDSISIDSSVTTTTTVDTIDNANTIINNSSSAASVWMDSTDTLLGTATATANIHKVASFAGSVSKSLGASLANPKDAGTTAKATLSLFGTGPVAGDINQGAVGDCYFLSSLAAFAGESPQVLTQSAVDLGDGTYAVEFQSSKGPVYERVNNSFTTEYGGWAYARPGTNNTIWAMVFEKAFCQFRTGANTYASISGGYMGEVYSDLGVSSNFLQPGTFSDSALFTEFSNDLANGDAVTLGTQKAPNLVSDHAYTLISVSKSSSGADQFTVRNPWGVSGDSLENNQGYATLTFAQLCANFVEACEATSTYREKTQVVRSKSNKAGVRGAIRASFTPAFFVNSSAPLPSGEIHKAKQMIIWD